MKRDDITGIPLMTQSKPAERELHDLKIAQKEIYCYRETEAKSKSFPSDSIYPVDSIEKERHAAQS
jgi:hypothetical protein